MPIGYVSGGLGNGKKFVYTTTSFGGYSSSGDTNPNDEANRDGIRVAIDIRRVVWSDGTTNRTTAPSDGIERFVTSKMWNPEIEKARNDQIKRTYIAGELYDIPGPDIDKSKLF